jgi:Peptidase propeptide and YPEB domain
LRARGGYGRGTVQSTFTGGSVLLRMKMRFSPRAFLLVAALGTAMTAAVPPVRADEDPRPVTLGSTISLDQAVKMAEQRFKARVVRAESQQDGGNTIYVLRLLNESGRVWVVRVDASNGAVL